MDFKTIGLILIAAVLLIAFLFVYNDGAIGNSIMAFLKANGFYLLGALVILAVAYFYLQARPLNQIQQEPIKFFKKWILTFDGRRYFKSDIYPKDETLSVILARDFYYAYNVPYQGRLIGLILKDVFNKPFCVYVGSPITLDMALKLTENKEDAFNILKRAEKLKTAINEHQEIAKAEGSL